MGNFHLEFNNISRGRGKSVTKTASYISGKKLHDYYNGSTYYNRRQDVIYYRIFQPTIAPPNFFDLQKLCMEIDKSENRYDARTARGFIGSLPNELPIRELIKIVIEYVNFNFIRQNFCAIVAIHEGKNKTDSAKNNPHVHIIVPLRTVNPNGFAKKKNREYNKTAYAHIWRQQWAKVQNQAYARNGLDIRVRHECLEIQCEYDREPTNHLSRIDWQKENHGEHTLAGDMNRAIMERNDERIYQHQIEQENALEFDLSR